MIDGIYTRLPLEAAAVSALIVGIAERAGIPLACGHYGMKLGTPISCVWNPDEITTLTFAPQMTKGEATAIAILDGHVWVAGTQDGEAEGSRI